MSTTFSFNTFTPMLSTEQMRNLDSTVKKMGDGEEIQNGYLMMKLAGKALFKFVEQHQKDVLQKSIAIFVGGGNNGGDGLVLAKLLHEENIPCTVFSVVDESKFKNEAKLALEDYKACGGIPLYTNGNIIENDDYTLVVDAMLGLGASGELRSEYANAVLSINSWNTPVIAADVPTGYDSTNHVRTVPCVRADETILFGTPRIDAFVKEGAEVFGKVSIAPLAYPSYTIQEINPNMFLVGNEHIQQLLPKRNEWGEKREMGSALIIAGSQNMTGAAALCTEAALRCGAGLVTLATPKSILPILQSKLNECVFCGLQDENLGNLQPGNTPLLLQKAAQNNAIAIGPGLSTNPSTKETVVEFLSKIDDTSIVIDADAINAVASEISILKAIPSPTILTPHKREYERLFGTPPTTTEGLCAHLQENAKDTNKIILLKGTPTWIATPDGTIYVVPTVNSGMAKGGNGDVLTGIIVSLLAQGVPAVKAAILGALLHKKTGEIVREELGPYSMLPGDIIKNLHKAFR